MSARPFFDMPQRSITIGGQTYGGRKLFFVAGPCVIESADHCLEIAGFLADTARSFGIDLIFKASYDKANRTSGDSFRGPGMEEGLQILAAVRRRTALPILTDVHEVSQVGAAAEIADVLQIPAFLCRQTDLIRAAASSGRPLNLKKGQFLSPWEMRHPVEKARAAGNNDLILTERGTTFGYNNLVVDFRSIPILQELGHPVLLDVTHSLQLPGAAGNATGGMAQYISHLARAGVAAGVDGLFFEVHDHPERAKSDGANALRLSYLAPLVESLLDIRAAIDKHAIVDVL